MQVNILEAKNRLSQLIKCAQGGEEVVIANCRELVARLVAANAGAVAPALGRGRDILQWLADNPLPAHARRTAAEIDAGIEDERSARD